MGTVWKPDWDLYRNKRRLSELASCKILCVVAMEEPGEQFAVVFVLIVTEPASDCVCLWGGGASSTTSLLAGSGTIYTKTTVHCSPDSSMLWTVP
jgi:hypothetical protein